MQIGDQTWMIGSLLQIFACMFAPILSVRDLISNKWFLEVVQKLNIGDYNRVCQNYVDHVSY